MKIVYISGPYIGDGTKVSIQKNVGIAKEYANALASKGIGSFCPHIHEIDLNTSDITKAQRFFYDLDAEFLIRSDAVLAIPEWEKSFGARHEIKIAKELALRIFYPNSPQDIDEIVKWNESSEDSKEKDNSVALEKVVDIRRAMAKYTFERSA